MSDFHGSTILRCRWCGRKFLDSEGPLCSCLEDYYDLKREMGEDDWVDEIPDGMTFYEWERKMIG